MLRSRSRPLHEKQGGSAIDQDADGGDDHHRFRRDRFGGSKSLRGFQRNGPHRDQEDDGVGERGQNRGGAKAVSVARARRSARGGARAPGQQKAEDVAEIVSGVRKQSHRVPDYAVNRLEANEGDIQARPDGEGEPKVARPLRWLWS